MKSVSIDHPFDDVSERLNFIEMGGKSNRYQMWKDSQLLQESEKEECRNSKIGMMVEIMRSCKQKSIKKKGNPMEIAGADSKVKNDPMHSSDSEVKVE